MSKVQVDTIVDKDDISAPSLTKGAIVTGVCTATSFDGAISEWVLGANGSSDYTFTGSGLTGAENDPTLYLKRGQKYRFKNSSGGHPFRIQSTANGSTGTAYNDGVTNNDAGNGTTLEWDVQFDAPDVLYYQCTSHGGMGGKIYIGNSGNSSTLVDLNVSGISTFSGDVSIADKIIHTGDTNTAIRFPAVDTITAETAGSERFRIASTGLVGLSTANPLAPLHAFNSTNNTIAILESGDATSRLRLKDNTGEAFVAATGDDLIFSNTSSVTERLRITSDGDVLIGRDSTSTGYPLCVQSDGNGEGIVVVGRAADDIGEIGFFENDTTTRLGEFQYRQDHTNIRHRVGDIRFASGGTTEQFRFGTTGQLGIAGANYGTSGQVLTSGGSGAAVQWADVSAGIWSTLASGTVTSGTTGTITDDGISSTYRMYKIVFYAVMNGEGQLGIDITTDGGSTWSSTSTGWTISTSGREQNGNWGSDYSGQAAGWLIGAARDSFWGEIAFGDTQNSSTHPTFNFVGGIQRNSLNYGGTVITNMNWPTDTAFNGIRWYSTTAAMSNVKWVLLGTTLS